MIIEDVEWVQVGSDSVTVLDVDAVLLVSTVPDFEIVFVGEMVPVSWFDCEAVALRPQ